MIANILGSVLLFPFIILLLLLFAAKKLGVTPSRRFGLAADGTVPFLAAAVIILIHAVWDRWLSFYVAGTVCILVIIFAVMERLSVKEFRTMIVLRKTWRSYFVLLTVSYFILLIIGLVRQIAAYFN